MILVCVAIASFLLAAICGWIFQDSRFWSFVDLAYYPLGCVGVVLFFFLATSEREEILILESLAQTEAEIQSAQQQQPLTGTRTSKQILKSTRGYLHTVREMAEVHRLYPTGPEKFAPAAAIDPHLKVFLAETEKLISDDSLNSLSKQCEVAHRFLQEIHDEGVLSATIASELIGHYADGLKEGWSEIVLNLDDANSHVLAFDQRVNQKVKEMQASWTFEEMEGIAPLLESEKETAQLLLQGLTPYLCVRVDKTNAFLDWQSQQEPIKESKEELRERVSEVQISPAENANLRKTQLLIWPYVLVTVLALKFAKGVAALKLVLTAKADEEISDAQRKSAVE